MKRNRNNLLILNYYAILESRVFRRLSVHKIVRFRIFSKVYISLKQFSVGLYKVKKTEELVAIKLY